MSIISYHTTRPVDYDDAIEAADLLGNFRTYWEGCEKVNNPVEARKQLLSKIVDRVFVYDDRVIAVALHGDFGVVLGDENVAPHDIIAGLSVEMKKGASSLENSCTQNGSDGLRYRSGHKCIFWFPRGERYQMMIQVVVKGVVIG